MVRGGVDLLVLDEVRRSQERTAAPVAATLREGEMRIEALGRAPRTVAAHVPRPINRIFRARLLIPAVNESCFDIPPCGTNTQHQPMHQTQRRHGPYSRRTSSLKDASRSC